MDSSRKCFNLLNFPPEIILKIFSYLGTTDLRIVLEVPALQSYVYDLQKSRMKNLRFLGFENQNNRRHSGIKEITCQMKDDIVTINDVGSIKIYNIAELKIRNEIHTGVTIDLNSFASDNVYIDEHTGVIILRNSFWKSQNSGYDDITIVETKATIVVHKNLKHRIMVDMRKCVAVVEDYVVIGDADGEMKIWERASGQCVAIFTHNLFLHSVAAGKGYYVSADIHSLKFWTAKKEDGSKFTAEELKFKKGEWEKRQEIKDNVISLDNEDFSSKREDWEWQPEVEDHVALLRVDQEVIVAMLTGPRGYRFVVLNMKGEVESNIFTGEEFYLNCNTYNTFLSGWIFVATFHSGICQVWDLRRKEKVFQLENIPFREGCVFVSKQKELLVTCNKDNRIESRNLVNGNKLKDISTQHPLDREDLDLLEDISKIIS